MAERQAALVVCPGRGTYGKAELGYLKRHPRRQGRAARDGRPPARRARPADHLRAGRRRPVQPGAAHARRHRLAAHLHRLLRRFPRHRPLALRHRRGHRQFDGLVHGARRRRRGRRRSTASGSSMRWARTARRASPAGRCCSPWSTRIGARCRACARAFSALVATIDAPRRRGALSLDRPRRDDGRRRQRGRARRLARRGAADSRARAAPPGQSRALPQPADARARPTAPWRLPAELVRRRRSGR